MNGKYMVGVPSTSTLVQHHVRALELENRVFDTDNGVTVSAKCLSVAVVLGAYYPHYPVVSNSAKLVNNKYPMNLTMESASYRTRHIGFDEQKRRFNLLARKWKKETVNLSSTQEIILHPAYQSIIGMGPAVVPFILRELRRSPDFWFWALRCVTGENPVTQNMRGDVAAMTKAWLDWGRDCRCL
jgi:hypothetical protein